MSGIATLVAFDGATTPVSHSLGAIKVVGDDTKATALWREALASVPTEGQVRVTTSLSQSKAGTYRCETRVVVPTMETVSNQNAAGYTAAPKVAYEDTYVLTSFHSKRSTVTGRRLGRQLAINIFDGLTTTKAATTAGPVPELIDQLVNPT